ncbi:hypothetical protein ALC62_08172 [Cyphomyrmex costatus]|uniref:Uncharacterized protein n=1 Tax=Cyphomyrmex costatus TaxID=456900 RepID=A0A195CJN8_9HYME|nr:hypothetical protein ALC62_08172 [Cyphomyrmex costatus]
MKARKSSSTLEERVPSGRCVDVFGQLVERRSISSLCRLAGSTSSSSPILVEVTGSDTMLDADHPRPRSLVVGELSVSDVCFVHRRPRRLYARTTRDSHVVIVVRGKRERERERERPQTDRGGTSIFPFLVCLSTLFTERHADARLL